MRIIISIILTFLFSSPLKSEEINFEIIYGHLQGICISHPEFNASSIDFYKESEGKDYEKLSYELSKKLHKMEGAIDLLIKEREKAKTDITIKCIDSILNTWPG